MVGAERDIQRKEESRKNFESQPREQFADVPNPRLREYLQEFSKNDRFAHLKFPLSNLQAARIVSSFANGYANKHADQDLEPMAQRVANELPNWVSGCYILTFVPIPKKTARSMFSRGIDHEEMQAYASIGWGLIAANDTKNRRNAIINRQEVLSTVAEALSGNEVSSHIAVDTDEQAIFADYYKQAIDAMENGTVLPEKPRIHNRNPEDKIHHQKKKSISEPQPQEVQTIRTGEIPVIEDKSLVDLQGWTLNRLLTFGDRYGTETREDVQVIQAAISRDSLAALEFISAYMSDNPRDALQVYEPYPKNIEIQRLFDMMVQCGEIMSRLQTAGYKVDNLADLYRGIAHSARQDDFTDIMNESGQVDTQEKAT